MDDQTILYRLEHIKDQMEKTQYWNVLGVLHELDGVFRKRFDDVLKGRHLMPDSKENP